MHNQRPRARKDTATQLGIPCVAGVGQWMAFFWQPSYYVQVYGKTLEEASLLCILPWAASAVCTNLAGWAADALINSERMSLTAVRKLMASLASLGPACFLLLLACGMVGLSCLITMVCTASCKVPPATSTPV